MAETREKRGLIIFPGALGDLICLLPAIRALSERHSETSFELMARPDLARFAVGRMPITAGHSIDRPELAQLFSVDPGRLDDARIFFGQFDRMDCFFSAGNEHFRKMLQSAARGHVAFYPFRPEGRGHVAECYLRAIGIPLGALSGNCLDLTAGDLNQAMAKLHIYRLQPGSFLLVLPGSGSNSKNWRAENFASITRRATGLMARKDQRANSQSPQVLVALGPAEAKLESIFRELRVPVLNDLELGELAGIARSARCFVGNDSGVCHLAAAAGAPGLVIFGPTDPGRWCPLGNIRAVRKQPLESLTLDHVWPLLEQLVRPDPAE